MRRPLAALPAVAAALVLLYGCAQAPATKLHAERGNRVTTRLISVAALTSEATTPQPDQQLPPGAIKHPGEKCATVIQPPDYQGCPGPPHDTFPNGSHWCTGGVYALADCYAAEDGFFDPPYAFTPRNWTESCINQHENGGSYGPGGDTGGRWQWEPPTWRAHDGMTAYGYQAPPSWQDDRFVTYVAANGYRAWTDYDGC